jgi:DNA-directed RNA polymerase subunit F
MPTHDELNARYDEHFDRLNSQAAANTASKRIQTKGVDRMRNDDIIVCDEDDLRAVLATQRRQSDDDEIVIVQENDLLDILNGG